MKMQLTRNTDMLEYAVRIYLARLYPPQPSVGTWPMDTNRRPRKGAKDIVLGQWSPVQTTTGRDVCEDRTAVQIGVREGEAGRGRDGGRIRGVGVGVGGLREGSGMSCRPTRSGIGDGRRVAGTSGPLGEMKTVWMSCPARAVVFHVRQRSPTPVGGVHSIQAPNCTTAAKRRGGASVPS